ncbi:MuDR family transposase, putative isoform 1 [Senna tora]|uniref:MuDR family transposase, putative isoform 1 n=1 Tax=Senna tora TaxID=362788 RepID=A0A834W5C9_9FABA|nr:MuDR family transposase, putative isoform 1 [Senna tora]
MVKGKLILISQSRGEFSTNDDGYMSYTGGEAHAVEINHETQFDDLKLKLAQLWNLEYKTLSIKYFLPGNQKTLISLSNDRDLKRMNEFHANSVTADVFISGKEGFDRESLNTSGRRSEIKFAETVTPTRASAAKTTPKTVRKQNASVGISSNHAVTEDHGELVCDMDATPADAVKKRRRTASWAITANVSDNAENECILSCKDNSDNFQVAVGSNDLPPELLVASWKHCITGVGQDFRGVQEFREALQRYAIAHRFAFRYIKNDTSRARAKCVCEDCPWRIHASWVPSAHTFRIKKMDTSHTCEGESWKSAHPSKNWLVSIVKDRLRDSPHHKPKEIASAINRDFGVELNYTQVWRAVEDAREQLQGSYKDAYNLLPELCEKMVEANPGSFIKLVKTDDKRLQRLFVSFYALIHGFQSGCRPLLFLDATSLKSKYHEVLLTATSLDGEDGAFPVAFCIVDVENDDNWKWFLEQLKHVVSTSQPLTFVSDREKGLKQLVLEVFENAHHGYSMYHLLESFKKSLKGPYHGEGRPSLPINFLSAAHTLRLDSFKMFTEQIKKVSSRAYDWVIQVEPDQWATAAFKGERNNHILFNVAEFYTNWIEEVRELTIKQKVEALTSKIMELINNRQIESTMWTSKLTPSKEQNIEEEAFQASGLKVLFSSDTLFEVHDDSIHVVDLDKWDCSCLRWKATGLPCRHAIAVFNCTHRSPYDFCLKYFTLANFTRMYSESINPVPESIHPVPESDPLNSGEEEEATQEETENLLPPCTPRPSSHSKKDENKTPVTKKTVTCTKCKGTGHNKATCKEKL